MSGEPNTPPPEDPKKPGWIEDLAQRSTGLPRDEQKPEATEQQASVQLWRFAGLGIQFAVTVALFAWIGWELDRWRGWNNAGVITLSLIAVIGNLYLLIKEALKANKD